MKVAQFRKGTSNMASLMRGTIVTQCDDFIIHPAWGKQDFAKQEENMRI
jgi:hypothetical protein